MIKKKIDLNTGNVYKSILKLGIPAVLVALFDEINGVIDTMFMGQYLGAEAVASMSIVMPFLILASALSFMFSEGASVSIARYLGANDHRNASIVASLTAKTTIITSVIFGFVCCLLSQKIVDVFGLDPITSMYSVKYIRYFSLGIPVFMIAILFLKYLYTEGYSKKTLQLTIIQVAANIVLNWVFLGVFNWGVEGAVSATLLSFLLQAALSVYFLKKYSVYIKLTNERLTKSYFKEVIPLGMPAFFTMILLAVTITIQSKIIADFGSSSLGVQTIYEITFSLFSSIFTGIMNAALVLMAYSAGAKNKARFLEILKKSALIIFFTSVIINLTLVFSPGLVGSVFTDSTEVLQLLTTPILILGLTSPFIFTTNTILFAMQPIGMEKTATILLVLQQLGLFLPLILLLRDLSFNHAMAAQPAAEVIGGIITIMLIPKFLKSVKKRFET